MHENTINLMTPLIAFFGFLARYCVEREKIKLS